MKILTGSMKISKILIIAIIAVAVIGLSSYVYIMQTYGQAPGQYDDFAKCLTDKGAKFYGSYQCGHCSTQKTLFGSSMKYVNYIECGPLGGPVNAACISAGIEAYPTWIVDGKKYVGVQSLQSLGSVTGCSLA